MPPELPNDATADAPERAHYVPLRKRRKARLMLQPPLTPMIDVTFLLLIYFIITSEFRPPEGQIPGSLPDLQGITSAQQEHVLPIRLRLVESGVENELVQYIFEPGPAPMTSPDDVYRYLHEQLQHLGPETPLYIAVRPRVRWEYVTEAFNQAKRAQFIRIGFSPSP